MAEAKKKATFYLPEDLLRAARVRAARADLRDSEIVEQALRSYLGFGVVEAVWARSRLDAGEAEALAVAEVKAHRAQAARRASRRS